jgi:hypothetical protein
MRHSAKKFGRLVLFLYWIGLDSSDTKIRIPVLDTLLTLLDLPWRRVLPRSGHLSPAAHEIGLGLTMVSKFQSPLLQPP